MLIPPYFIRAVLRMVNNNSETFIDTYTLHFDHLPNRLSEVVRTAVFQRDPAYAVRSTVVR